MDAGRIPEGPAVLGRLPTRPGRRASRRTRPCGGASCADAGTSACPSSGASPAGTIVDARRIREQGDGVGGCGGDIGRCGHAAGAGRQERVLRSGTAYGVWGRPRRWAGSPGYSGVLTSGRACWWYRHGGNRVRGRLLRRIGAYRHLRQDSRGGGAGTRVRHRGCRPGAGAALELATLCVGCGCRDHGAGAIPDRWVHRRTRRLRAGTAHRESDRSGRPELACAARLPHCGRQPDAAGRDSRELHGLTCSARHVGGGPAGHSGRFALVTHR
ncbi:Uncharacterised protein [Mycobacteroides abscessus subsp. abscessus]|nr:Uncharacterised protein [Mycobacteroides abscessus subsp. abscessus]